MIYRKAPPHPTRLLLRVVAVAGAGALVSTAACGGNDLMVGFFVLNDAGLNDASQGCSEDHPCGLAPSNCYDDAGDFICGVADAGEDGGLVDPCVDDAGNPTCGLIVNPDAGDAGDGGE